MDKCNVNGPNAHEAFKWLRSNTKELQSRKNPGRVLELPWNFCRWVVDRDGKIQMYLNPTIQLHTSYELIEHLLELKKPKPLKLLKGLMAENHLITDPSKSPNKQEPPMLLS